jgi:acyl carrier protein phosphodiesterase
MSDICHKLHLLFNCLPTNQFPFDSGKIPSNGIYVIFETGETAHGTNRIVRIGTHKSENRLLSRLQDHFVRANKDGSIFRKNIGRAILHREHDSFLTKWDVKVKTKEAKQDYSSEMDAAKQRQIEQQVSQYIRSHLRFVVFRVDSQAERKKLESKIISTVSLCSECHSSDSWLGRYSPIEKIRESGLWVVNELYKQPFSVGEYDALEKAIMSTERVL